MKRICFLLMAFLAYTGCDKVTAPDPDEHAVPEVVIKAIVEQYPEATNLSLVTLQTDEFYVADFWVQSKHYQAIINQDGSFQALNLERPIAALPLNGLDFVTHQFQNPELHALFAQLDPNTEALQGYLVKASEAGQGYLIKLDTLGARISIMEEPISKWWRLEVSGISAMPQNIQSVLLGQAGYEFQDANRFIDSNQVSSWQAAIRSTNFLSTYQFGAQGNVINSVSEDLLGLDAPNTTFLELDVTSLPTVMSDFLNARFTGWEYVRGILILNNNDAYGFSVVIKVHQITYYTRFDITGSFTGATRG